MDSDDFKIFLELLDTDNYCLLYNGNFVDAVTSKIINITKVSLIQRGELIKTQNRFSYFIAECFQNIIRHGGHKEHNKEDVPLPGFFMAKIKNNFYDLVTGNLIDDNDIYPLKQQFDKVNALSEEELKVLYKKVMTEGTLSEKGGAGLGLIDMAKKSSQKLEYKFQNHNNIDSMFYQRVVMNSNSEVAERFGNDNNIEFGISLHNTMIKHNILMLQKSDFSRNTILPMLNIIENNISSDSTEPALVKVIYQILIEILQNINQQQLRSSRKKEGIFFISKHNNSYRICSGNYIDNENVDGLRKLLDSIDTMNEQELEELYLNELTLSQDVYNDFEGAIKFNLGKLLLTRFSYTFNKFDNETYYLGISASI